MSRKYTRRTLQLFKDINLQIAKGELVFLAGPSGAGKTTLLKLLFREEEPSKGQIIIHGKDVTQLNSRGVARLRQQMGLVFQEFKFLPHMTALDNVALAALVAGGRGERVTLKRINCCGILGCGKSMMPSRRRFREANNSASPSRGR